MTKEDLYSSRLAPSESDFTIQVSPRRIGLPGVNGFLIGGHWQHQVVGQSHAISSTALH